MGFKVLGKKSKGQKKADWKKSKRKCVHAYSLYVNFAYSVVLEAL